MKKSIGFDGQVMLEVLPTGIGTLAVETAKEAIKNPAFDFCARIFSKDKKGVAAWLAKIGFRPEQIEYCTWFKRGVYLRAWHWIPIPYSHFFSQQTDVSVFWNYDIPPGVKGKTVVYVHDMTCMAYPETMDSTVRRLLKWNLADTCKRADAIITLSAFSKSEIVRYMGVEESKIHVIPCGIDQALFRPINDAKQVQNVCGKYGIQGDYFLYLGTLEPRKNISLLLKAYKLLLARLGDKCPQLVLAGKKGWQFEQLDKELKDDALSGHLVLTDYVPREEIPSLMCGALAFVFPSLYEGFGLPPLEAMACGAPVIVSACASLPEVVGDAGIVVPVDAGALAEAMLRLFRDPDYREECAKKGILQAGKFTWENAARQLLEICDRL